MAEKGKIGVAKNLGGTNDYLGDNDYFLDYKKANLLEVREKVIVKKYSI